MVSQAFDDVIQYRLCVGGNIYTSARLLSGCLKKLRHDMAGSGKWANSFRKSWPKPLKMKLALGACHMSGYGL
jgi:hypothetical protein